MRDVSALTADSTVRQLSTHKVNGCNNALSILVLDGAGDGGASHKYLASWPAGHSADKENILIHFQDGPIAEVGTNGITHEALLAIVVDRLQGFQRGQYACRENAIALTHLEDAMHWLQHRTRQRLDRGVEGTHQK